MSQALSRMCGQARNCMPPLPRPPCASACLPSPAPPAQVRASPHPPLLRKCVPPLTRPPCASACLPSPAPPVPSHAPPAQVRASPHTPPLRKCVPPLPRPPPRNFPPTRRPCTATAPTHLPPHQAPLHCHRPWTVLSTVLPTWRRRLLGGGGCGRSDGLRCWWGAVS